MIESKFNFRLFYLFIYFVNEIESFRNEKREFPRPREITEEKNFMIDCTFTRHKEEFSFGWQTVNFPVNIDDIVRAKNACVYIYIHIHIVPPPIFLPSRLTFRISISLVLSKRKKKRTRIYLILIIHRPLLHHPRFSTDISHNPRNFINGRIESFQFLR